MSAPKRARQVSAGRLYEWRAPGSPVADAPERFWSVTTIIDKSSNKQGLINWAARTVAEYAVANIHRVRHMLEAVTVKKDDATGIALVSDPAAMMGAIDWLKGCTYRNREYKANLGSTIHAHTEAYMKRQPFPEPPTDAAGYITAFRQWLADWSPTFEMAEASVFSRTYRYAGTLDAIVRIPKVGRCVIDYKSTGSGVYPEAALQLAAYRNAEFIGRPDGREEKMPAIDATFVLWLKPDGYEFVPVDTTEPVFRSFRHAIEMFRWVEEIAQHVIGSPLDPPVEERKAKKQSDGTGLPEAVIGDGDTQPSA